MVYLIIKSKTQHIFYLSALSIIILTAPSFWLLVDSNTPGILDFPYLGGFLHAIGWNITLISTGLVLLYISKVFKNSAIYLKDIQIGLSKNESLTLKKQSEFHLAVSTYLYFLSYASIGLGSFYLLHNISPMSSETILPVYYAVLVLGSFLTLLAIILISKFVQISEEYLKNLNIKTLIAFIFRTRNKHYPNVASKALYAEIHDKAIAADDTVADNANEFEEDLLTTLEKLPPKHKKIEKAIKKI